MQRYDRGCDRPCDYSDLTTQLTCRKFDKVALIQTVAFNQGWALLLTSFSISVMHLSSSSVVQLDLKGTQKTFLLYFLLHNTGQRFSSFLLFGASGLHCLSKASLCNVHMSCVHLCCAGGDSLTLVDSKLVVKNTAFLSCVNVVHWVLTCYLCLEKNFLQLSRCRSKIWYICLM